MSGGAEEPGGLVLTRQAYLLVKVMLADEDRGTALVTLLEAVASTGLAHPEWDMNEEHTWAEWEATA